VEGLIAVVVVHFRFSQFRRHDFSINKYFVVNPQIGSKVMKTQCTVALSMLAGAALGAAAIQTLHAQAKPPVYYIAENDVTNPDAYAKEYIPRVRALSKASGGRYIAAGKATSFEGEPPKSRVVVLAFDSMQQIEAYRNSAEFKEARKIGDKYAKFRTFAVEGVSQ
jgi:uncharacterized protein (DUF1330 family)